MVNENILKYLRENKDRFPKEMLKDKLLRVGYPPDQVEEGIRIIYGGAVPTPLPAVGAKSSFFDFRSIRVYRSFGEKFIDFLAGFFTLPFVGFASGFLFGSIFNFFSRFTGYSLSLLIVYLGIFAAEIWAIFYLWRRRHYFAWGLLCNLILALLLIGTAAALIFIFFTGGMFH